MERSRNQILVEFGFSCQNVFAWMACKYVSPSVILLRLLFAFHQVFFAYIGVHSSLYISTKVDINGFLLPTAGLAPGSRNQLMHREILARSCAYGVECVVRPKIAVEIERACALGTEAGQEVWIWLSRWWLGRGELFLDRNQAWLPCVDAKRMRAREGEGDWI